MNYYPQIQINMSKYLKMSKEEIQTIPREELIQDLYFLSNLQNICGGNNPVEDIESSKIYIELCRREGKDPRPSLEKRQMLDNAFIREFL